MPKFYRTLRWTYDFVLDFFIPRFCAGCRRGHEAFCMSCQNRSYQKYAGCLVCGSRNQTGTFCTGTCRRKTPRVLKKAYWAGRYEDELKDAIWQLKYKKRNELAKPLGKLIARKFENREKGFNPEQYCIIPIPLHPVKEQERGFNQAEYIANSFSQETGIALVKNALIKTINTNPQAKTLHRAERIKNLEHAFSANMDVRQLYSNKIVILIDDVATTGATLFDASRALAEAGAENIIGLVVAHGG